MLRTFFVQFAYRNFLALDVFPSFAEVFPFLAFHMDQLSVDLINQIPIAERE